MEKRVLKSYRFGVVFGWVRRITSSRRKSIKTVRKMYKKIGLERRPCTICGSEEFTLLAETDRYGFDLKNNSVKYVVWCKPCQR